MKTLAPLRLLGPALLLAGCTVGPDYRPPDTPLPKQWQALRGQVPAGPMAPRQTDAWWTVYADPLLDRLVSSALSDNLDVQLALSRIDEARAARQTARAALMPSVNLDASTSRNKNAQPVFLPGLQYNLYQLGFDAAWEADLFGRLRRQLQAAAAREDAAGEQRRDVMVTLTADVARNYVEYRGLQHRLKLAEASLDAQQKTLALTEQQLDAGVATRQDLARARSQTESLQAALPPLQSQLFATRRQLEVLLGRQPGALETELQADGGIPVAARTTVLTAPVDRIRRRPDIRAAERKLAETTALHGAAIAQLYPDVSLNAFLGLKSAALNQLFNPIAHSWTVGAGLLAPLFNFGLIESQIRQAEAREKQSYISYRQTVLVALKETDTALNGYLEQDRQRESLAATTGDQAQVLELTEDRFRHGVANYLEVLDAQRQLYSAQTELARSQTDVATGLIAVYKALGG